MPVAEDFPVAILAGGMGTRLRPLTEHVPKGLVEVAGRPFLEHQLALLKRNGLDRVVLCVGYLGHKVCEYFGDGSRFGMQVRYSHDGPSLLGTAGSIRKALPLLDGEFFVLYGDSYLPCDYRAVADAFRRSGKRGLMTVFRNEGRHDTSNVEFADGCIRRYDKQNRTPAMRHIDYGLGVFRRSAFAALDPDQARDLARVYQELLEAGELAAYEVSQRFYEIGSAEGLRETAAYLSGLEGSTNP
jgi:NDP-sugar pyrophosphorylase family protein